jgi:hypothetical protein
MAAAPLDESWITASSIDLVSSLVTGASEGTLGEGFFAVLAPSLFKCLGEAEDRDVLQVYIIILSPKNYRPFLERDFLPHPHYTQGLRATPLMV